MASALLALVGIPLALLAGAIAMALRVRRRFARTPGAFRCKLRSPRGTVTGFRERWDRRPTRGLWVHDVLMVQRGRFRQHVLAIPVRLPEDVLRPVDPEDAPGIGLGPEPHVLRLQLDDGPVVDVAVSGEARSLVVGPFLAAAIPAMPPARAERPAGGRRRR